MNPSRAIRALLGALIISAPAIPVLGAAPLLEKVDVFFAGADGYALYRIPGVVVTTKGTVLAFCEARRTGKSDWDAIDLMLKRSTDGGKTWGEMKKIADVPGEKVKNSVSLAKGLSNNTDVTYNNPVMIADREGTVHLLFCLEYNRCFYSRSTDDGISWTPPEEVTRTFDSFRPGYDWKVIATGPGHGIQLSSGRLLVPVWLSLGTGAGGHSPSITATIYSDDQGRTWKAGDIAVPNTNEWVNPNETAAVELSDGRVMLNVRSQSKANRRLVTTSRDGAKEWSQPRFDDKLLEPICMGSILRVPRNPASDKSAILFSNPDNLSRADGKEGEGKPRDRRNLSIKASYDDGATWALNRTVEPEWSGYSDLACLPDGTLLCFYERPNEDGKIRIGRLTLARFNFDWLLAGTVAGESK